MAITYKNQNGRQNSRGVRKWNVDVYMDGNRIGEIRKVFGGYCYKPIHGERGRTYAAIDAVKQSIERA